MATKSITVKRLESIISKNKEEYNLLHYELTRLKMQNDKFADALVRISEQNRELLKLYRELLDEKMNRDKGL